MFAQRIFCECKRAHLPAIASRAERRASPMNKDELRRYEMLVRVRDFGTAHEDIFPSSTLGGQAFAAVAAAVTELSQQSATQLSARGSTREGLTTKSVARAALRDDLDAIIRTARAIALDVPG